MSSPIQPPINAPSVPVKPLAWLHTLCFEKRARRRGLRLLGLLTIGFIFIAALFSAWALIPTQDVAFSQTVQTFDQPPIPFVAEVVSLPGYSPWNALMSIGCCLLVALWLHWKVGAYLAFITVLQGLTTLLLRVPIRLPRPMETELHAPLDAIEASSFPSGHTTMYVVLLGFVAYLLWRHTAPGWLRGGVWGVAGLLILLVGPARVQMGAHWIGDVIVGYLLGFFFLLLAIDSYETRLLPHLYPPSAPENL